ncbi:MAG: M20 family metallopeptidase [Clostridia bacterium]|nr:M20 family metallopeptidase [Clostridia bacterium]
MGNLYEEANILNDELLSWQRHLHENPEIGMNLPDTTAFVMKKLREMGYEPKEICQSGVLAIAGGKIPGKTFLIRGDMDALPMAEETGLPHESKNGYMHACGHDLHTSMMLGAAKLLKRHEDEIKGTVKLMFQPAEENLQGAKAMIEAGILENPAVDAAMMIHVFADIPFKVGTVLFPGSGPVGTTSDWFHIKIKGKGGHGSTPHLTIDPLNAAAHIYTALAEINSREVDPVKMAVVTVGEMHGGSTGNIIPDTAFMQGTIRTFDNDLREFIKKRVIEIAEGTAKAFRCKADVRLFNSCPMVNNDKFLSEALVKYNMEMLGPEVVLDYESENGEAHRMNGSEDFAYVGEKVPSVLVKLIAQGNEGGTNFPHHHPKVMFDEKVLPTGVAVYANSAIEWLKNH